MPHLQQALDAEWETSRVSVSGARTLAGWSAQDATYRDFRNLGELGQYFEQRHDTDARDDLLLRLSRRAWRTGGGPCARR